MLTRCSLVLLIDASNLQRFTSSRSNLHNSVTHILVHLNQLVNIMVKNAMDVVFGALAYWFVGYGISYGQPSNGFMGMGDFVPDGEAEQTSEDSGLLYSQYIFQFAFAATATTIVSGAVAMRLKFYVYCCYSVFAIVTYSFVAHWVWADDGW